MLTCEVVRLEGFRERFLYLKMQKNVTLDEIAESIGSYKATLSKVVNGKAKLTDEMLTSLSNYFGVTKSYLLGESSIKNQKETLPHDMVVVIRKAMEKGISSKKIEALFDFLDNLEDEE